MLFWLTITLELKCELMLHSISIYRDFSSQVLLNVGWRPPSHSQYNTSVVFYLCFSWFMFESLWNTALLRGDGIDEFNANWRTNRRHRPYRRNGRCAPTCTPMAAEPDTVPHRWLPGVWTGGHLSYQLKSPRTPGAPRQSLGGTWLVICQTYVRSVVAGRYVGQTGD
jgi:hypothetical protein